MILLRVLVYLLKMVSWFSGVACAGYGHFFSQSFFSWLP
jgi:hypothetical protein